MAEGVHEPPKHGSSLYVVEVVLAADYPDVRRLSARAREAAGVMRARGTRVRFVRTIYVPEDGACLLVMEASTPEAARRAATIAGLSVAKVSAALSGDGS